jgi:septum formation protein
MSGTGRLAEKNRFILASASPRRKDLLAKAGYKFDIIVSNVDESALPVKGLSPIQFACSAAIAKANDVAQRFNDRLIVASDTVVDYNGEIIGKAENAEHAKEIIRKLFSGPHKVITAIAMVKKDAGLEIIEYDSTTVYPTGMSEKQIEEHIASDVWKGKAGAYGIQCRKASPSGEGGDKYIERIEGSETNVMGFSMELFEKMIKKVQF